jgi:hypothetical protein
MDTSFDNRSYLIEIIIANTLYQEIYGFSKNLTTIKQVRAVRYKSTLING